MRRGISILLLFLPLLSWAQIPSETRTLYTRKDGLSNNTITTLIKDNRGFLWIGTSEGLNRFDGSHFTSWFSDPNNFSSLSGNNIYDILQYQPGRLLVATNNGLSVLNTLTNTFENEKIFPPGLKRGSGVYVRSLFQDRMGRIYVNYAGEIDVLSNDLHFLYRLTDTDWGRSLKGVNVNYEHWVQDSKGRIWLPSDNSGLCILDEKKRQVYSFKNNPLHYSFLKMGAVRGFYYDEIKEEVFLSLWGNGVEKHEIRTGKLTVQLFNTSHFESRTINAITRKNNRLIVCGGHSFYSLDPVTMAYENIYQNINASPTASFFNCLTVLNDLENIWIGSETRGLLQIPYRTSFLQIPLPYQVPDYTNTCTGILRAANHLLYFAYGEEGLVEMDQQGGAGNRYQFKDEEKRPLVIYRITADSGNDLLVGTTSGLFLFNTETKKIRRSSRFPAFTDKLNVSAFVGDCKGNIWISFRQPTALGYYEQGKDVFHFYPGYIVDGKKVFDSNYVINRMTLDSSGNTWMISYQAKGEIACYESATAKWKTYPATGRSAALFAGKELNSICVAGKVIWVGNIYGLGLVRYDYEKDSLRRIGRNDGLLSENILSINRDKHNNLFLSTMTGINYYNTHTNEMRTLIADDGNIDWGFAYIQYYDAQTGQLIYGLNDRIVIAEEKLWDAPPSDILETYIDDIKVNNILYPFDGSDVDLSHSQKNISIHFTSINYNRNSTLVYAYKMTGVDNNWNTGQQVTTTNYSNLSPGDYTFLVKTKGPSGLWGPVNHSVRIIIHPAFWQTVWFWVISILSVSLLVFWLERRRVTNIRKNARLKQKLAETEMMALRSQMNPHFIFNCLNAIDNLMQTNQADKATTYLTRFAKLIRSLLEYSKNNVIPFHKDFETLQLYLHLEQFRASNKFLYDLKVDEELLHGDYKVPPLIVQPFVENAILHGLLNKQDGDRKLLISAGLEGGWIKYTITDNGVGRATAMDIKNRNRPEHKSFGIRITTERLQLHNRTGKEGDIVITDLSENGVASGTRIEIRIKIE